MLDQASRVLILTPPLESIGGIANYYYTIKNNFTINVDYCYRGTRNQANKRFIKETIRFIKDIYHFFCLIHSGNYNLIHINTSLSIYSILRDSIYIMLANLLSIPCITFFRGWSTKQCNKIESHFLWLLRISYFNCCAIITLSSESKFKLMKWGYNKQIYLETTVVDESLLIDFDFEKKLNNVYNDNFVILFLARLEKEKGIFELIQAFKLLKLKYPNILLIIAGKGNVAESVKNLISIEKDIQMVGYVMGHKKAELFKQSSLYVLPSYSEGMPNSVLEAMAFGLPVICTKVGGLPDIIVNEENGLFVQVRDYYSIYLAIERLYLDTQLRNKISSNNYVKAYQFYSKQVVSRLEAIYKENIYNLSL